MDKKPSRRIQTPRSNTKEPTPVETNTKKSSKVAAPHRVEESIEAEFSFSLNTKPVVIGLALVFIAVAGLYAMLYFYK